MKKIFFIIVSCLMLSSYNATSQELIEFPSYAQTDSESQWEVGNGHEFTMNYNLFGKSVAQGAWQGGLGYATGMWLSGNKTEWGIVGSILAVNIPILLDNDYKNEEVWIGKNAGALSVSLSLTFTIEMHRNGKMNFELPSWLRKY